MNPKSKLLLFGAASLSLIVVLQGHAAVKGGPATMKNGITESELSTITLTEKAEQRLGVETALVKSGNTSRVMKLGGTVIAVPGHEVSISAPVAGTVLFGKLAAGMPVEKGQAIMKLSLMPPLQDLLNIEEDVQIKKAEHDLAQAKAQRAERLFKDKAVSEKSVQQAQAELAAAQGALNIAKARMELLKQGANDTLPALVLESPIDGVLQKLHVATGQMVPSATPLFEVSSQNPVWMKVPVYAGDVQKIASGKKVQIEALGGSGSAPIIYAEPVQGPQSSDAANATLDLYYQLDNKDGAFRTGQKAMALLPLKTSGESMTVAYSAIVYDMYGGTWVYRKIAPLTYSRRRVELSHVADGKAVLTRGIDVGNEVVIAATAEIFGTEFGGGK